MKVFLIVVVLAACLLESDSEKTEEQKRFHWSNNCLDSTTDHKKIAWEKQVKLKTCDTKSEDQFWYLRKTQEIRRDKACLDYAGERVMLYPCHGLRHNQRWIYDPKHLTLRHGEYRLCLAISVDKKTLKMEKCNPLIERQRWPMEFTDSSDYETVL